MRVQAQPPGPRRGLNFPRAAFPAVWGINVTSKWGIPRAACFDSTMKTCFPSLPKASYLGWVVLVYE